MGLLPWGPLLSLTGFKYTHKYTELRIVRRNSIAQKKNRKMSDKIKVSQIFRDPFGYL